MANISFKINGQNYPAPRDWQTIQILATFDKGNVQANISTEEFNFINEAAVAIRQYIAGGLTGSTVGIFEGLPIEISINDAANTFDAFEGYLDLTERYRELSPVEVEAAIKDGSGIDQLQEKALANSYGYLFDRGVITQADFVGVQYVVEKEINFVELVVAGLTLYLLNKELAETIRRIIATVGQVVAIAGAGVTGSISSLIYAILALIIESIYATLIVIQIVKLTKDMIEKFISPIRTHETMRLGRLLETAITSFGFSFVHNIPELDSVVYLPSQPSGGGAITQGTPKAQDFGYRVSEMIELCKRLFNAKIGFVGNTLHIRTKLDPFWRQTSTFVMPDILELDEVKQYNTDELKANILIAFQTDPVDAWTIQNFTGTNFEVITTPVQFNDAKKVQISGLDNVQIPCALGNRKDGLNELESFLKDVAGFADSVVNFFGGNSNLAGAIQNRVGMLKVSQNNHSISKLLYVDASGKLPANHRDLWKAKVLWDKYHIEKSFIQNNFRGQKRIFEGVKVPFGFNDFLALINNSYFTTHDGKPGEAVSIKWQFGEDFAEMDFKVEEKYTANLQETNIEP